MTERLLQHLLDRATGTKESPTPWPAALVVALLAVAVVGVLCFIGVMQRRSSAAVLHRLDVVQNETRQKQVLLTTVQGRAKRAKIDENLQALAGEKDALNARLVDLQTQRDALAARVAAVTSWDQV